MKHWLAILFNLVLAIVLVIPGAAMPRQEEEEEESPITFIVTWDNVPYYEPGHVYVGGEDNLEVDDEAQDTITWTGIRGGNFNDSWAGRLELAMRCYDEGCSISRDIYFDMFVSMNWVSPYNEINTLYEKIQGIDQYYSNNWHIYWMSCMDNYVYDEDHPVPSASGGPSSAACSFHVSGIIPAEEIDNDQEKINNLQIQFGMETTYGGTTPSYAWTITVSTSPIVGDCDSWATSGDVASGNLDPTSETGSLVNLLVGQKYRLTISGGPWNDGTHARFDAAYRQGSGAWLSLAASTEKLCSSSDENSEVIVFAATHTILHIRVNDWVGHFADNTGSLSYKVELVTSLSDLEDCGSQYLVGMLIKSGSLDPTSSTGSHIIMNMGGGYQGPLPIGSWIAIVLSGGPWRDDGIGDNRYDAAIKMAPSNTWAELSEFPYTGCSELDKEYSRYLTAYVQITSSSIDLRVNDEGSYWSANTGSLNYAVYATTYSPLPQSGCATAYQIGALIMNFPVSASSSSGRELTKEYVEEDNVPEGGEFPKKSQKYAAIETSGLWYNAGVMEAAGAIVKDPVEAIPHTSWSWSSLAAFPAATCVILLDPIGHIRIYIPFDKNSSYWFRVDDTSFGDNTGSLDFSVYEATLLQVYIPGEDMPGAGVCDDYYEHGTGVSMTLTATNSDGYFLPIDYGPPAGPGFPFGTGKGNGDLFAIATSGGPWSDNGSDSYEVAISDNEGDTWSKLQAYSSSLCAQSNDGDHILLYTQYLAGRRYKVRVYDSDDNFSNNSDSIDVIYYDDVTTSLEPWTTCSKEYPLTMISISDELRTIPAQQSSGVRVSSIVPGLLYALEISENYFWAQPAAPTEHRFDAQISDDEGQNWVFFGPGEGGAEDIAFCMSLLGNKELDEDYQLIYRIYFEAPSTIRLRVNDTGGSFVDNTGYLHYMLYSAEDKENPPDNPDDPNNPNLPPDWGSACYEDYQRPTVFFKDATIGPWTIPFGSLGSVTIPSLTVPVPALDDWIEYLSWALRNYFAWCPEHTEALKNLFSNLVATKEPLATFDALKSFITDEQKDLESFDFTAGGESILDNGISGGETGTEEIDESAISIDSPADLVQFLSSGFDKEKSPWFGGQVDLNYSPVEGGEAAMEEAISFCASNYASFFGDQAAESACKFLVTFNDSPFFQMVVLVFDLLVVLFMVIKYIPNWFKRIFKAVVGVK